MRIALTASGGGHTGYALALAAALREKGHSVVFIVDPGDGWSLERIRRLHPGAEALPLPRLRSPGEPLYKALPRLPGLAAHVHRLHRLLEGLDGLIATGSNHSLLAALAAVEAGVPAAVLEAVDRLVSASRTPRLLSLLGLPVLLHWPLQRRLYPRRGLVVGPVYEPPRPGRPPVEPGYVLILTGSMGNPRLLRLLLRTRLERVVVQTGRLTPPRLVEEARPGWLAFRYTPDPAPWIRGASVVVSHQGLGLVEAALAYGKPVVLGFNPDLHMTSSWRDAVELARLLGTKAVDPSRVSPNKLEEAIEWAAGRRPPRYPWGAGVVAENIHGILSHAPTGWRQWTRT